MTSRFFAVLALCSVGVACSDKGDKPEAINPNDTGFFDSSIDTASPPDTRPEVSDAPTDAPPDVAPICVNGMKDTDETDVDCGGTKCGLKCAVGKKCGVDADCADGKCNAMSKVCDAPSCADTVRNGAESDVDCGGETCAKCGNSKKCGFATDCTSGVCLGGFCAAPTCTDGVRNGTESDIDCGGGCTKKCVIGDRCGGAGDCASNTCASDGGSGLRCLCPSGMTRINVPTAGGTYCMDQTEVSNEQYAKLFIGTGPATTGQPAFCSWNTDYIPTTDWPAPESRFGNPVRGVDWCDALAYCKKQGKELCGKIGGGETPVASYNVNTVSKWHNACSQGTNAYPYAITMYDPGKCNGGGYAATKDASTSDVYAVLTNGTTTVFDAGRFLNKLCIGGPLSDIYQLSGNVAEWEDSCSGATGASDKCLARGGGFTSSEADLRCDAKREVDRNTKSADIGIRCCL